MRNRRPTCVTSVRAAISVSDLVIVTIGANDFDADRLTTTACRPATVVSCYAGVLRAQRSLLTGILDTVNALRAGLGGQILVTGYWNIFLDGAVGRARGSNYVHSSDAITAADNAQLASVAAASSGTYVDIYTPFKGDGSSDDTGLLAADGDHPNAAGHELIARTLLAALNP